MKSNMNIKTFESLAKDKPGTIYRDTTKNGIRYIIMRGPASLTAYIGFPKGHFLWGFQYDDIPINVHGGLTYSSEGKSPWPKGWYWYGWDYAHAGDDSFYYDDKTPKIIRGKKWTIEMVESEISDAIDEFLKLIPPGR